MSETHPSNPVTLAGSGQVLDRQAEATFEVTRWDPATYDEPTDGPCLARIAVSKAFNGKLSGESVGEGLFCGMNAPANGAGYAVSERFAGRLGGRPGTFVLQHLGVAPPDAPARSFGVVVPGSATGELAGLRGEVEFGDDHTVTLRYSLPESIA